jgi:hypothetical protein
LGERDVLRLLGLLISCSLVASSSSFSVSLSEVDVVDELDGVGVLFDFPVFFGLSMDFFPFFG